VVRARLANSPLQRDGCRHELNLDRHKNAPRQGRDGHPYRPDAIWIQIFGDLCVIPFILLVPLLAGQGDVGAGGIAVSFAKALLIIVLIFLAARWALPRVLEYIVAAKSREMFIISVITICFGTAMLTFYSGLPLTLGALIAGLVISESEYAAQTISDMIPMTESFVALFFVSVGMLINLDFFTGNFALIAGLAVLVIAVKIIINGASLLISKLSLPHVIRTSFYVAQIGEFSFVLAFSALTYGLISRIFTRCSSPFRS